MEKIRYHGRELGMAHGQELADAMLHAYFRYGHIQDYNTSRKWMKRPDSRVLRNDPFAAAWARFEAAYAEHVQAHEYDEANEAYKRVKADYERILIFYNERDNGVLSDGFEGHILEEVPSEQLDVHARHMFRELPPHGTLTHELAQRLYRERMPGLPRQVWEGMSVGQQREAERRYDGHRFWPPPE